MIMRVTSYLLLRRAKNVLADDDRQRSHWPSWLDGSSYNHAHGSHTHAHSEELPWTWVYPWRGPHIQRGGASIWRGGPGFFWGGNQSRRLSPWKLHLHGPFSLRSAFSGESIKHFKEKMDPKLFIGLITNQHLVINKCRCHNSIHTWGISSFRRIFPWWRTTHMLWHIFTSRKAPTKLKNMLKLLQEGAWI